MGIQFQACSSEPDVLSYLKHGIAQYAQGMFEAGEYPSFDTSFLAANQEVLSFFHRPKEKGTQQIFFLFSPERNARVGYLEVVKLQRTHGPVAFLNYIEIDPAYRRQGLAKEALLQLEDWVKTQGLSVIELNVLSHRQGAIDLYRGLDYTVTREWVGGKAKHITRIDMRKTLT